MKPLADLVMETTSTTGTGNITLAAVAGWARIDDRFGTGDLVRYCIRNGSNAEVGIGTYQGSHVLARTTVLGTIDTGVVDWTTPSALSLTGTSTVRVVADEGYFHDLIREAITLLTGNATLAADGCYGVQANSLTLTLPASPAVGDRVRVFQAAPNVTGAIVDPNSAKIAGVVGTMAVDVAGFSFAMRYVDATYGWTIEP